MTLSRQTIHSAPMEDVHEHDAWKPWFELHGPKLLLCARLWTRSAADAEDVVQEAFVRYWRHQRQFTGDPLGLLLTSVRRAAVDLARRESRRSAREERIAGEGDAATPHLFAATAEGEDRRSRLEAAVRRLPDEQRDVLVLKIWGELTFAEIAAQLEVPLNTAASRYRYALAAMRQELNAADRHG